MMFRYVTAWPNGAVISLCFHQVRKLVARLHCAERETNAAIDPGPATTGGKLTGAQSRKHPMQTLADKTLHNGSLNL